MDNCSFHGTPEVKKQLIDSGMNYKFSGVCQCPAAPVELVIGLIKKKFFKLMAEQREIYQTRAIPNRNILNLIAIAATSISSDTI
jgi:hypothetical protein